MKLKHQLSQTPSSVSASRQIRSLPSDIKAAIQACRSCEDGQIACGVLDNIIENYQIAENEQVPICQDTGMACVFLEIGQDVHITDGDLTEAVNEGVRRGYTNGYLRKSVVKDPVRRGNTGDNTPAMLYTEIVPGEHIRITVGPKGFGSENMSAIRMFKPSAGIEGIKDFILETVENAGPNPCPPMVVGVGIGGTFDKAALLAKKALMRPVDTQNPDPYYADLEKEMLEKINQLGIGPQGFGGTDHSHRLEHRDHANPYRRHAMCDQHQLPRNTPQNGGALIWNVTSHCH